MRLSTKQKLDKWLGNLLLLFSLALARPLGLILRRNHSIDNPPSNIIYIKILGIGSVYLAADAIASLKKKYPNANHVLLCSKSVEMGVKPLQLFDELFVLDDSNFSSLAISGINTYIKALLKRNLWVADLEVYSKLTTIFSLFTFARNRFGFSFRDVQFRDCLNTHNIYFNQFSLVEENYNTMAKAMGVNDVSSFEFKQYKYIPARNFSSKKILLNNTCSELSKERLLTKKQMHDLIIALHKKGFEIFLSGAKSDYSENEKFLENLDENILHSVHNISGKFSFNQFIEFMYEECLCVITVDSAPLHLAKKLGIPTLSIWGPSHPSTRIKENDLNRCVYLKVACSPCVHMVEELPCKGDNFCIKEISTPQLLKEFDSLIHAISTTSQTD